ncbi:hypothetical protein [Streptomyces dysideae]|uniref:hypothetical protein n=1 Tax=Streptomyces dysideae TaxID=909626 RepID=UPI00131E8A73|nr:hypothetical protein [Streptomyces dysideae]
MHRNEGAVHQPPLPPVGGRRAEQGGEVRREVGGEPVQLAALFATEASDQGRSHPLSGRCRHKRVRACSCGPDSPVHAFN